jgi:hypothetical protein
MGLYSIINCNFIQLSTLPKLTYISLPTLTSSQIGFTNIININPILLNTATATVLGNISLSSGVWVISQQLQFGGSGVVTFPTKLEIWFELLDNIKYGWAVNTSTTHLDSSQYLMSLNTNQIISLNNTTLITFYTQALFISGIVQAGGDNTIYSTTRIA